MKLCSYDRNTIKSGSVCCSKKYFISKYCFFLVGDELKSRGTRPLKANQRLNEMTKSPQLKETVQRSNWTERKPSSRGPSPVPRRASSMTNLRGRTPDSTWSQGGSAKALDRLDSSSIRQAVYDEWLAKKHSTLKEQVASKASEKKKQEEKEEEERQRKQLVWDLCFI